MHKSDGGRSGVKKYWKYLVRGIFWIVLVMAGVTLLYRLKNDAGRGNTSQKDTYLSRSVSFTRGNIHMDIQAGFENKIRLGRYVQLTAQARNTGGDFEGTLQISLDTSGQTQVYERPFEVSGEKKQTVHMYIPVTTEDDRLAVRVLRENGQTIYSGEMWLNSDLNEDEIYVGILCKDKYSMKYMEGADTNVTYLTLDQMPVDIRGLDWLDVLVASNVDLQTLQEDQTRAVINWVRAGGTLVLADSGEAREIAPFRGKLFEWRKVGISDIYTSFVVSKKDLKQVKKNMLKEEKAAKLQEVKNFLKNNLPDRLYEKWKAQINRLEEFPDCVRKGGEIYKRLRKSFSVTMLEEFLSLDLTKKEKRAVKQNISIKKIHRTLQELEIDDSTTILKETGGKTVLCEKSVGTGKVIVSGISLQLPSKYWDAQGKYIKNIILEHRAKRDNVTEGTTKQKTEAGIYNKGLKVASWNKMPNLKLYLVFLGVYILLIGPLAGHFLKRSRHRLLIWGIIPVSALVFSVLIYLTGTSTRLEGQCINYLNQITLGEKGIGILKSNFRVMNDSTGQYDLSIDGGPIMDYGVMTRNLQKEIRKEMTLQQGEGKTTLSLGKIPYFTGINLSSQTSVRFDGSVDANISIVDLQLLGSLENKLCDTLEDCVIYSNGTLYYLGDLSGKKVYSLGSINNVERYDPKEDENNYDRLARKLFGRKKKHKLTKEMIQRRWALLDACIENADSSDSFFYGFIPEGEEITGWYDTQKAKQQNMLGGIEQLSGVRYGETGILRYINVRQNSENEHQILRGGE